ncbi:hypothetical protein D3C87_1559510 [compost metagenome]
MGDAQRHRLAVVVAQHADQLVRLRQVGGVHAPGADDGLTLERDSAQVVVVLRALGESGGLQVSRLRGPVGKKVSHVDATEAQALREPNAPADGGVVDVGAGDARVEHDESEARLRGIPGAAKPVPELPALRDGCCLDHVFLIDCSYYSNVFCLEEIIKDTVLRPG